MSKYSKFGSTFWDKDQVKVSLRKLPLKLAMVTQKTVEFGEKDLGSTMSKAWLHVE